MRIAILGNSGSGKSTLARWFAARSGATLLDLDTVAWEPGQIAVPRAAHDAEAEVVSFCLKHPDWVIEGCYANLIAVTFAFEPHLLFLNPGEDQCLANCRARPWEPHKYKNREEQEERLSFLLDWVGHYYIREGNMSLIGHTACFAGYRGPKIELRATPDLAKPSDELLSWAN